MRSVLFIRSARNGQTQKTFSQLLLFGSFCESTENFSPVFSLLGKVDAAFAVVAVVDSTIVILFLTGATTLGAVAFAADDTDFAHMIREQHFGTIDVEEVTVDTVEHCACRVMVMVHVRHHCDVLRTHFCSAKRERPANSHFLPHVFQPLTTLGHLTGRHEKVRENSVPVREFAFRLCLFVGFPAVHALVLVFFFESRHGVCVLFVKELAGFFVARADREVVLFELLHSSIQMNLRIVDDEDFHFLLL